jgi:hypothetical protein
MQEQKNIEEKPKCPTKEQIKRLVEKKNKLVDQKQTVRK